MPSSASRYFRLGLTRNQTSSYRTAVWRQARKSIHCIDPSISWQACLALYFLLYFWQFWLSLSLQISIFCMIRLLSLSVRRIVPWFLWIWLLVVLIPTPRKTILGNMYTFKGMPYCYDLYPAASNNMCGRSGFLIHGGGCSGNPSEGCIVIESQDTRYKIKSGATLKVTA